MARRGQRHELVAAAEMDIIAFPDLRLTSVLFTSEGRKVMSEVRITGTNTGEIVLSDYGRGAAETTIETLPATGKLMDVKGVIVHEFGDGGLIVAERQYWNMLELLSQLGMFTPVPKG